MFILGTAADRGGERLEWYWPCKPWARQPAHQAVFTLHLRCSKGRVSFDLGDAKPVSHSTEVLTELVENLFMRGEGNLNLELNWA
jgi:hypothetical protein